MATLTYNVCDRCGREFERIGWTSLVKGMKNKGKKLMYLKCIMEIKRHIVIRNASMNYALIVQRS